MALVLRAGDPLSLNNARIFEFPDTVDLPWVPKNVVLTDRMARAILALVRDPTAEEPILDIELTMETLPSDLDLW